MSRVTDVKKMADFILKTPVLAKVFVPFSNWYCDLAGYRKLGLKFDDLISEESPVVQKALSRLPADASYARIYRIQTSHQCAVAHQLLPKNQQLPPKEDTHYLIPYILEAEAEAAERKELNNIVFSKK